MLELIKFLSPVRSSPTFLQLMPHLFLQFIITLAWSLHLDELIRFPQLSIEILDLLPMLFGPLDRVLKLNQLTGIQRVMLFLGRLYRFQFWLIINLGHLRR